MTTPAFKTIPVTPETLRGPQSKGGTPSPRVTGNPFTEIATLEALLRQVTVGSPPETVEFSLGQALLTTQVFRPDPDQYPELPDPTRP